MLSFYYCHLRLKYLIYCWNIVTWYNKYHTLQWKYHIKKKGYKSEREKERKPRIAIYVINKTFRMAIHILRANNPVIYFTDKNSNTPFFSTLVYSRGRIHTTVFFTFAEVFPCVVVVVAIHLGHVCAHFFSDFPRGKTSRNGQTDLARTTAVGARAPWPRCLTENAQ